VKAYHVILTDSASRAIERMSDEDQDSTLDYLEQQLLDQPEASVDLEHVRDREYRRQTLPSGHVVFNRILSQHERETVAPQFNDEESVLPVIAVLAVVPAQRVVS
jgi:uncharacterized membrane protein